MPSMTNCLDQQRRRDLVNSGANGIDSVHVSQSDRQHLRVVLFRAWEHADKANFRIDGGRRIRDVQVEAVKMVPASGIGIIDLTLNKAGDDSTYVVTVIDPNLPDQQPDDFDSRFASAEFLFRPASVADEDCAPEACPDGVAISAPIIDYLAKDYSSFRRLMLDRLSQTLPEWGEQRAADLGITVVEALAYVADHLSYFQDAVATEAYLDTARRRISVRRHCRLVDYRMHEGCNARAWVHVEVADAIPADGLTFFTQSNNVSRMQSRKPVSKKSDLESVDEFDTVVFEPVQRVDRPTLVKKLYPSHNEIRFYTWGNDECCLPTGAMSATLETAGEWVKPLVAKNDAAAISGWDWDDELIPKIGDLLLFEEVIGSQTGQTADADPQHRHVVRLTRVSKRIDRRPKPVIIQSDSSAQPTPTTQQKAVAVPLNKDKKHPTGSTLPHASFEEIPILEIAWDAADALPFSLCLSTGGLRRVSVARGNILLVDHGLTFKDQGNADAGIALPGIFASVESAPSACDRPPARLGNQPRLAKPRRFFVVPFPHRWSGLQQMPGEFNNVDQLGQPVSRPLPRPLTEAAPYPDRQIQSRAQSRGLARWEAERLDEQRRREHRAAAANPRQSSEKTSAPNLATGFLNTFVAGLIGQARSGRTLTAGDHESFSANNTDPQQVIPDFIGPAIDDLKPDPRQSRTSLTLTELAPQKAVPSTLQWVARCDLLASGPQDRHFVVEIDDDGFVWLRFGDGQSGMTPRQGTKFHFKYRIGNGVVGNVGAEAITGVIGDKSPSVLRVRNPLPARGGVDPEPSAAAKLLAPTAFREKQLRAVVADDYAKLASADDRVLRAVACLRWTGSGAVVQVAVDFKAAALAGVGNVAVEEQLIRREIEAELNHYRRMAHEVRVVPPREVPLKISLHIVVVPSVERGRVKSAIRRALGNRELPDGTRGFFHPDNLTFGQNIDVSALVARVCSVPGVLSVEVQEFRRKFGPVGSALSAGTLLIGPLEIARLDDDPAFPEHGQLELQMEGGR